MKAVFILIMAIYFNNCVAQQWVSIPATKLQKLYLPSRLNGDFDICCFRVDSKILVVEKSLEADLLKLFEDDSTAFGLMYTESSKIMAVFPFDSLAISKLGIEESDYVVILNSRKIKKDNNGDITWDFHNPYKDGRSCYIWFYLRNKIVDNNMKMFISKGDKVCHL